MYFLNPGISLWELPNRMYCHLPILILGCTSPLTLWIPSVIVDVQPNTVYIILNSFWSHRMATKIWISRLAYEDLMELGQNFLFLDKSMILWEIWSMLTLWRWRNVEPDDHCVPVCLRPLTGEEWRGWCRPSPAGWSIQAGSSLQLPPHNTLTPGQGCGGNQGLRKFPGLGLSCNCCVTARANWGKWYWSRSIWILTFWDMNMTIRICNSCSRYPQCSSKCGAKICDGSCKGGPGPNSLLVYLRIYATLAFITILVCPISWGSTVASSDQVAIWLNRGNQ